MTDAKLMKSLSRLGLPMFEPSEELDVNETLAEVVKSQDSRLWEGFPVPHKLFVSAFRCVVAALRENGIQGTFQKAWTKLPMYLKRGIHNSVSYFIFSHVQNPYPCTIIPDEPSGYLVQFVDIEEAFTGGATLEERM